MPRQIGNISIRQEDPAERFIVIMKVVTGTVLDLEEKLNQLLIDYPLGITVKGIVADEGDISVIAMCKVQKKEMA